MTKDLNPKEYKQMMEYLTRKKPETIRNPVEVPQTQLKPLIDLEKELAKYDDCLLYTSPSPRDRQKSRMPSSA